MKYTELIKEGKSENEAVGTVISEFGNLEELSGTLGISDIFKTSREDSINRRKLTFDEIKGFIEAKRSASIFTAAGVFLFINCVNGPVISEALHINEFLGILALFLMLAAGIICCIIASSKTEVYKFLYSERCSIDAAEKEYLTNHRREKSSELNIKLGIGILLIVFSVVFDDMSYLEDLANVLLFVFVGAGVFLLCQAGGERKAYYILLGVNSKTAIDLKRSDIKYSNKKLNTIMSVYWQSVTCLYLCISFATDGWPVTWIIWPIAAVARKLIIAIFEDPEIDEKLKEEIYE